MKTIFIAIPARQQARNILRTDAFRILASDQKVKLVIFVPELKLEQYQKEFFTKDGNVVFEGIEDMQKTISSLDRFFYRLSAFYTNTPAKRLVRKQWLYYGKNQKFRYFISIFFLSLISIRVVRNFIRFLDFYLVRDNRFINFFDKYKPDIIFSTNILAETDAIFLRQAKKRGIISVSMISSFDNISIAKYPFRFLPDKLIVHNEIIKEDAIKYLGIKEKDIFISGMPHFDHYINSQRVSRGEFCRKLNIDPAKKIVLFASIAELNITEWQVLHDIDQAIKEKQLPDNIMVLVRHHPVKDMIRGNVEYSNNIVFDNSKTVFKNKEKTFSEILKDDMNHLADSIFHSEMIITTRSTMSIDASAFNKPIIDIAFDGWEKKPYYQSVKILYDQAYTYYQPIIKSGGVKLAHSFSELISFINMYLKNPSLDSEGRKKIVKEQCWKLDGKSGERIGRIVLSLVK